MKKILLVGLALISLAVFGQTPDRSVIIEWDDTVTVRDLNNTAAYKVVNFNYPGFPVGLNEDMEVFIYRSENQPPIDYRLYNLVVSEGCLNQQDSIFPAYRIYVRAYDVVERDTTDIFESIEQEENTANQSVFPYEKQLKYFVFYMGIHRRETQGFNITAKQQAILDKVEAKMENMWMNYIESENKKKSISDQENIDIDFGWNDVDPETE